MQPPRDTGAAPPAQRERLGARVLTMLIPLDHPADAVYGLLATGSLLAVESGIRETYADTILAAVIAATLYWLLHAYSRVLGERIVARRPLASGILLSALGRDWAIMRGAAIPIVALVLCWAVGADQDTGVTVAFWSVIGALLAFELLAALRVHASFRELFVDAAVGMTMGAAILALRIILH